MTKLRRIHAISLALLLTASVPLSAPAPAGALVPGENGLLTFTRLSAGNAGIIAIVPPVEDGEVTPLTPSLPINGDSDWSPDGSCIIFYSERDGDAELYAMRADGSQPTRLTVEPSFDYYGSYSPDGTKLAYVSNRDGDFEIFTFDLANGTITQLTKNTAYESMVAWSPDGAKIVFSSNRDGDDEIYVMNPDGSDQTRLTDAPGADMYPEWSPDSQQIVFASQRSGTQQRDIWIMDADGENERSLVATAAFESDPTFSPDGTLVAFTSNSRILIASSTDGSNIVEVTSEPQFDDRQPRWQSINDELPASLCPTVTPRICGDANSDGTIKSGDALIALKKSVGTQVVCAKIRCDTDDGGTILASDALRILQKSVALPVNLVCPEVEV